MKQTFSKQELIDVLIKFAIVFALFVIYCHIDAVML